MSTSYIRPIPCGDPALRDGTVPLAGGWARFDRVERLRRGAAPEVLPVSELPEAALAPFMAERPAIAGIDMGRPSLMGILNVTPDSFSDGGAYSALSDAIKRAWAMVRDGADVIDIGGESTRPGAVELTPDVEAARVTPVIDALVSGDLPRPISLDTRKSAVSEAGLNAGAAILNDVSGLRYDPKLAEVAGRRQVPLILMHSIGTPDTMQTLAETAYTDVLLDVYDGLKAAIAQAEAMGVARSQIMVDPGIGFGKTLQQNLALLKRVSLFHGLGCPILLGVSRKAMVRQVSGEADATQRGPGSAALGLWAVSQGIQMLRVHDISLHKQAIALWQAVHDGA